MARGRPIYSNAVLNKENDVAPLIFSYSLFHSFMTFGKKQILECISSAVMMWDIKRFPQDVGMTISGN